MARIRWHWLTFLCIIMRHPDICIYCAAIVPPWSDSEPYYPQCDDFIDKPKILTNKNSLIYLVLCS